MREITAEFVKTRTASEPPTFISHFKTNDGLFISTTYGGKVSEVAAREYAASSGDPLKFIAWFNAELSKMPGMHPTGSGLRTPQLVALLQSAWPDGEKNLPSERTFNRRFEMMVELGELVLLAEHKKQGNLYRFPPESAGPSLAPAPATTPPAPPPTPPEK